MARLTFLVSLVLYRDGRRPSQKAALTRKQHSESTARPAVRWFTRPTFPVGLVLCRDGRRYSESTARPAMPRADTCPCRLITRLCVPLRAHPVRGGPAATPRPAIHPSPSVSRCPVWSRGPAVIRSSRPGNTPNRCGSPGAFTPSDSESLSASPQAPEEVRVRGEGGRV